MQNNPKELVKLSANSQDYMGKSYKSKSILLGFVNITKNENNIIVRPDISDSDELNKRFVSSNYLYNKEYASKMASQFQRKSFLDKHGDIDNLKNDWKWLEEIIPNYLNSLK